MPKPTPTPDPTPSIVTDPTTTPTYPDVMVAGLAIPADLAGRILAALRGTYPSLAQGRDDEGTVRAVLMFWISTTLSQYEGLTAETTLAAQVQAIRDDNVKKVEKAREKALADATRIREAPSGAAEPNMPADAPPA